MALNDQSVLKVGTGRFFTAPVGTPRPTDLLNVGPEWENMGHTSLDDILSSSSEGGEVTRFSSLQSRNFRQSTAGRTDSFGVNLLQFEEDALKLYYGSNTVIYENGDIGIPEVAVAEERAWLFLFQDGNMVGGLYAPRASFGRAEDFNISSTEELSSLPIQVTPMSHGDNQGVPYRFIPPREVEGAEQLDPSP